MRNPAVWMILWASLCLLIVSCSPEEIDFKLTEEARAIPTTHPLFASPEATVDGEVENRTLVTETPRIIPTINPVAPLTAPDLVDRTQIINLPIFADTLEPNWALLEYPGMEVDLADEKVVHNGRMAVSMTPVDDFSRLFFVVDVNTEREYLRDEVLGLSFWLNGDNTRIELENLAVTVVGSNISPFWIGGDDSVVNETPVLPLFSETRLYDLNLNRSIPPYTWVEVQVWLDDLLFDPDYKYVTGFYIQNDKGFFKQCMWMMYP